MMYMTKSSKAEEVLMMNQERQTQLENIIILLLALLSAAIFIISFFPYSVWLNKIQTYVEMGRTVERAFSFIMLILCGQLMKRKHTAWSIVIIILMINMIRGMIGYRYGIRIGIAVGSAFFFLSFLFFRKDFCCPSSKTSKKKAILFFLLSFIGVLINAGLSYHYMRIGLINQPVSFFESLKNGMGMIFGMRVLLPGGRGIHYFESLVFFFSWACIFAAVLYAVRPWLAQKQRKASDVQHARTLLNLYSQNPAAYLTLEEDKMLFFGEKVDGVIPYGVVNDTIVVNGDPVCADEDFPQLLSELKNFCKRSAHKLFILNATDHFLEEYKKQGFGYVKCGEEARFCLDEYEISGKKGQKMRMNINHAKKAGVTVEEYHIKTKRDPQIEQEFDRISKEWLEGKKGSLLQFVLGSVGLENPMDKRYFYAKNVQGKIVAFIVYVPFMGLNGYMADVTRHGNDAPGGVMEYINYEAFQVFKSEGVKYGSLGVAPLAGLDEKSSNPVERLLCFVYNHLNECYGFRDLHRAKKKYSPNEWVPSYYVYLPSIPTPDMFYAIVRIQNPQGMMDYIKSFMKNWKKDGKKYGANKG